MENSKVFVTWSDVENYIDKLARYTHENLDNITGVYGIPRGGLVLAVLLSHKLNLPLLMAPTENCIIIDDIADSGRTLLHFTNNDTQFNNYFITTMYYHERSLVKPDFYLRMKEDKWIVFPWEVE
ncbi:phosphoribosyltransferase [uncultured Clostridium sp.]|uniref:phosphoribosyltransferase n=1 Tax=uncultured Clostridium sp. TaxID=59620 RepID=UPI0026335D2B|nr:phosphoribosyltransferase [uncultured Clostridium sp.]